MGDLNLALIGNCSFTALLDTNARIVWSCLPRPDGDPVFCSLLNGAGGATGDGPPPDWGYYEIDLLGHAGSEQRYLPNTGIVETILHDGNGSAVEILDFAPRHQHHGRSYRPTTIIRLVRALRGNPRIVVRLRPRFDYGEVEPAITRGSNHIRYVSADKVLRLSTDAPIAYVLDETPFVLDEPITLILGPDEPLRAPIDETGRRLLDLTRDYWRQYARSLALPFEWQEAVIRAAITLKMCTFEETGAVIAAVTTSIPEAPGTARNWDYRFCWVRDAYFVIQALNSLGTTVTMENYLHYITNIVAGAANGALQPVYGIAQEMRLIEREASGLAGYRGMGPVRVGNAAYAQLQNDSYGAVILASAQAFFDQRLARPGGMDLFHRLETLGDQAVRLYDKPDAGLWELRTTEHVHTFSSVMCWAACDRLSRIAAQLRLDERAAHWREHADTIRQTVLERAWSPNLNSFVDAYRGGDGADEDEDPHVVGIGKIDASLLLMHELRFIEARDPQFLGTLAAIESTLKRGTMLYRYVAKDDFGYPETAFTICTFWYIDALAAIGRKDEARTLFERMLSHRNHVGLLSEDIDPATGELWGNYPQTYSMVGLINSAMRLSKPWEEAF
ncbi:glucoamylase [Skermanella stibiiresistens SB22]|uniref:Glucoamylase n=1 Tax=Skermanella stibiiresistens SB22 TaxID=1385369 RepID=W9H4M6_9PROT|nr:glycoside hydrolase family 15 protein [Skermanella stibiiresistens]EWY41014.1 glucoamylase [Skermanella stibiiresistens SB22]